jgi:CRISPR-associated Csx11 family protein
MTHNLTDLADKRDALLLAEMAAWLHMLGKFHECFLCGIHNLAMQIPSDLTATFTQLDQLLRDSSWSGIVWNQLGISEFQTSSLSFFDFIKKHHDRGVSEGLLKLMVDAHGQGSGIEKGVLDRFAIGQSGTVYLSTALGSERNSVNLSHIQTERQRFYNFLQTQIQILHTLSTNSTFNWKGFRNNFIDEIKQYFLQTVAETRRPLSDVSLFDQTSASVAFLKATLAQNLLTGWKDPIKDPKDTTKDINIQDKYRWRLLKVGINGLAFWGDSVRISDLLARKELISKALNAVQKVIEEKYPLGLEIYRNENGSVFIVPDIADLLNWKVKSGCLLREYLQRIANCQFKGEAFWTLELSDRTRNTLKFGKLATSKPENLTANSKIIASHWNIKEKRETCPICGLRPIGSNNKALKLKVCDICCDRRADRAKEWTENLSNTTIWIDEVADTNGRLALIVGRFELESWLTGEAFNSIVSSDPQSQIWTEPKGSKQHNFDYQQLHNDIDNALKKKPENKRQFVPNTLLDGLVSKNSRGLRQGQNPPLLQPFYNLQVTDTDLGEGRTVEDPSILALAMLRQNPSFARLRRVWETTQNFWKEVIADVPDTQLPKVRGRLMIKVRQSEINRLQLVKFGNYDLVIKNVKLSVLLCHDYLITTDNLRYVAKQLHAFSDARVNDNPNLYSDIERAANFIRSQLLNQQISIEEPTGYGVLNRLRGQLEINNQEINNDGITFDSTEYSPVIQILTEPSTFMALVPANNINSLESLNLIRTIKTKYEREMGKVRNRLPLHLGVVYFDRRTPLRSALDAGRQMLSYKSRSQKLWQVIQASCPLPTEATEDKKIEVTLTHEHSTITWSVPSYMGDGTTEDVWYPYVFLETNGDDNKVNGRLRKIKSQRPSSGTIEPCWLVNAGDLKEGDQIYFTPSTFDFEYLDSTARRFDIYYDEKGRRHRKTRPFYLEDLDRIQTLWEILQNLKTSQRHQVIYTIEATREMWYGEDIQTSWADKVFEKFVADTLANAAWPKNKQWQDIPERQQLIDAGVRGKLADIADLYMEILKER